MKRWTRQDLIEELDRQEIIRQEMIESKNDWKEQCFRLFADARKNHKILG